MERYRIPIEGMTCPSCVGRIHRALRKVAGVSWVRVELANDCAIVAFDGRQTTLGAIGAAVLSAGYEARVEQAEFVPEPEPRPRGLLARLGLRA